MGLGNNTAIVPRLTSATVGTAAATVLQANPTRNGLVIANLHASQTISIVPLGAGVTPTSLGIGTITIPAGGALQIFGAPAGVPWSWTDGIVAIASGATTLMTMLEF